MKKYILVFILIIMSSQILYSVDELELKIYEKLTNQNGEWINQTTGRTGENITDVTGFEFTKGGDGSNISNPIVYVTGNFYVKGTGDVLELKIEGQVGGPTTLTGFVEGTPFEEAIGDLNLNGTNEIIVTQIRSGNSGNEVTKKFVLDTGINDSKYENKIIGELNNNNEIDVEISELSGIIKYKYRLKSSNKTVTSTSSPNSNAEGEITISSTSTENITSTHIATIPTTGFEGNKVELELTVYDKLGHEKTFNKKTYFIPTSGLGVKSTVEKEVKERKSRVIIVDGNKKSKIKIERSTDTSRE
ncbi:MAG: hypothetical protein KAH04_04010 [Psychrilyobacter sp.]|nr:hypothetical protein [Psychrilyobacter sp.]